MKLVIKLPLKTLLIISILAPLILPTLALSNQIPKTVRENMKVLPSGIFEQGSHIKEVGYQEKSGPSHKVNVSKFYLSKYEVTVAESRTFVQATDYVTDAERNTAVWSSSSEGCWSPKMGNAPLPGWVPEHSWRNPGFQQSEAHPVVCVSWNDAMAYVNWLRIQTALEYRLPSESEFEYALKAGTKSLYASLDEDLLCSHFNHADMSLRGVFPDWKSETSNCSDDYQFTAPIGTFKNNDFGIFNLADNVSEWTADCWHETYEGAPGDGGAWLAKSPDECKGRVLRGGDFTSPISQLRPSHRTWIPSSFRTYHAGFRVALDI